MSARFWSCFGASVALLLVVGWLGPNAASPPLGPGADGLGAGWAHALTLLAAGLGTVAVWLGVRGAVPARQLLAGGVIAVVALVCAPPVGTADIGSYAAYGRIAELGQDPYAVPPVALRQDPVVAAAEPPWEETTSVYGPVATASMRLAAALTSTRSGALKALQALAALAFLLVAVVLHHLGDPRRVHVLWTCNPLLLLHLVSGAHVDALLCLPLLLAVWAWRRHPLAAGALLGVAGAIKATALWPAVSLGFTSLRGRELSSRPDGGGSSGRELSSRPERGGSRNRPRLPGPPAVVSGAVAVLTAGLLYLSAGPHVFDQARQASRFVSAGTPWRWVASGLERLLPHDGARALVGVLALVVALWVATRLRPPPGHPAARAALVGALAWALTAPYQLPWYDAAPWCLLALVVASGLDRVLLAHTAALTLAYLPGRLVELPWWSHSLQVTLRSGLAPVVIVTCVAVTVSGARADDRERHNRQA